MTVGLDSINSMNKWSNLFGDTQSFNIMTNKARQGNPYKTFFCKFAKNEHVDVLDKYTSIHLFVMYRSFMDLFINLERKLFGAIMPTIGSDLTHLTPNRFTNLNDTLSLYCAVTRWHIRSNAVTLQERINVLNSSDNFLLKDPITDPGVLSDKLQKEVNLINDLGGTDDGVSITQKSLCILFRKGINSTVEGRELYKSVFEKIDSKGDTYIFQRLKLEVDHEYRDFVLPKLIQMRSGKAFMSNIHDDTTSSSSKQIEFLSEEANSTSQKENKQTSDGIQYGLCFDFIRKGHCARGKQCKYSHSEEIKGMVAESINANAHFTSNSWSQPQTRSWSQPHTQAHYSNTWSYDDNTPHDPFEPEHEYSYFDDEQSHFVANRSNWRPTRGRGRGGKGKGRYPSHPNRYRHFGKGSKGKGKGKGNNRFPNSTWEQVVPSASSISATEARILELNHDQHEHYTVHANTARASSSDNYNYDFNEYQNDNYDDYYDNDTY
jgi:hypothetical protein